MSITPDLFPRSFPKRARLTSSRPDAILVTSYLTCFFFFHLLTPCVTQQARDPTKDQHFYLRKTPSTNEFNIAAYALN
eukprot:1149143-Pelagomonas_calceolata.AAC.5